ncbi:GNAT family N-acetyltransferase [Massilia soli]|uniref:GNAT family N-acetyltransferase n=1 Tax=Massilia soli TaxID=2792854 RepID=A0ABS7SJG7_9BURK|nr:GNAT family N-acetyltransferase [Massilia soli]MBZ2206350.1 GNAT family N-acetyltransferase [Massilia soli]
MALTIRRAVHTDLAALFAYLNDHLADNGKDGAPLFQPMARSESRLPPEKEAGFITGLGTPVGEPGWRRVWLAFDGTGAIAGHIDLRARLEKPAAHRALLGMGVHRDQRRLGLGARLIEAAMDWARAEAGIDWIDLEVLSSNRPARGLYERCGFTIVGEIADMFRIDGEALAYTFMTRRP